MRSLVAVCDEVEARTAYFDRTEVGKSGGDAADRQTAVMDVLARYVVARD